MNHIDKLRQERDDARQALRETRDFLDWMQAYYALPKFTRAPENDYAHVSTDIAPKIANARRLATPYEATR